MRTHARLPLQVWKVAIAAHDVPPRWRIRGRTFKLPAPTAEAARLQAIRWTHADQDLPPWRPFVRVSLAFTTATSVAEASVSTIATRPPSAQLELFGRQAA